MRGPFDLEGSRGAICRLQSGAYLRDHSTRRYYIGPVYLSRNGSWVPMLPKCDDYISTWCRFLHKGKLSRWAFVHVSDIKNKVSLKEVGKYSQQMLCTVGSFH